MPLKLHPPHTRKSPYWTIRGTYIGVAVERSAKTTRRSAAAKLKRTIETEIEAGQYNARPEPSAPTFLSAAVAYLKAGRRAKGVARLIEYFGETPLPIEQAAIDAAAIELKPNVTPATRNVYVYTPISAIQRHALGDKAPKIRRPKGAKGNVLSDYLNPADAFAIIAAADDFDPEFGAFLRFLLYTGARPNEPLSLHWTEIEEGIARFRKTKNDDPRAIRLRDDLRDAIEARRPEGTDGRVFRFRYGGNLKHKLMRAKLAALGLPCPKRRPKGWRPPPNRFAFVTFRTFRHTYATWMRRYGGLDEIGLVATGNWRDPRSARRYAHAVPREEWTKAELMPAMRGKTGETA